jgi:hypothetical protein
MQVASEIKPDGSFERTLIYKEAKKNPAEPPEQGNPFGGMAGDDIPLEDMMILPAGPEWKVKRTETPSEATITYTRMVAANGTLTDDIGVRKDPPNPDGDVGTDAQAAPVVVEEAPKPAPKPATKPAPKPTPKPKSKPKSGKPESETALLLTAYRVQPPEAKPASKKTPVPLLSNTVTVREIDGGKLEYKEVIRWRGELPADMREPDAKLVDSLTKALPPSVSGDTPTIKKITYNLQRAIWQMIFGPGEPILPLLMMNTDLAEYRFKARLSKELDNALLTEFGNRMTAQERAAVIAQLRDTTFDDKIPDAKSGPPVSQESGKDMGAPISIFLRAKMPGKVLSTNGQVDPDTGEVLWTFYSWAPAMGEITLTAICEKP